MRRKNRRDAIAGFHADREDALCYAGTDALFSLRSGTEKFTMKHKERNCSDYDRIRQKKRVKAHNGVCVPLAYTTKPKSSDFARDTIRRPAYAEFLVKMASFGILYD